MSSNALVDVLADTLVGSDSLPLPFIVTVVESSATVIYLHFDQMSAGGLDDLDGLLCVFKGNLTLNKTTYLFKEETLM